MERQGNERNHRRNSNGKGKKERGERGEVKIVRVLAEEAAVNCLPVFTVSPFLLQILLSCESVPSLGAS